MKESLTLGDWNSGVAAMPKPLLKQLPEVAARKRRLVRR
jgi:hypothetical protein